MSIRLTGIPAAIALADVRALAALTRRPTTIVSFADRDLMMLCRRPPSAFGKSLVYQA